MKENKEPLSACPFCGGEATLHEYEDVDATRWVGYVRCESCLVEGPRGYANNRMGCFDAVNGLHTKAAVTAWNRRAQPRGEDAANGAIGEREAFEEAFRRNFEFPEHADQFTFRKGWEAGIMQARSALTTEKVAALKLTVWYGTMPESNGKTNWTAILHNGDVSRGITLAMSEYEDRVRYEADRMRWMIGELDKEPFLLDYDADKHSGYVSPHPSPRALLLNLLARIHRDGGQYVEAHGVEKATHDAEMEVARLHSIIHSPESDDFLKGVSIEAEYQRQLHGVDDTDARYDWHQWFWVVGYLAGKALAACKSGEGDGAKARHHLVTTAALLHNWHNTLTGKPAASVHSNRGKGVADAYLPDSPNEVDRLFPLVDAQTLEKKPR